MSTILFTSQRPLERCENIASVYNAYDGPKKFCQMDWWRQHPDIMQHKVMVTDEIPAEAGGKVIFIPHGIEGTKTYGLDQPRRYATDDQCSLISYAVCQSPRTVNLMANQLHMDRSKVLPLGMPRTDHYVRELEPGKKVYLYAPTYGVDEPIDWNAINNMLHDDEFFIVKPHMLMKRLLDREYDHVYEVSNKEPSTPYLMSCNVLITNYSSIMLDGLCARIPTVLFTKNLSYLETRGMYYAYPVTYSSYYADNETALVETIRNAVWKDEDKRSFFCESCDGNSTRRVIDLIKEVDK